jgi:hypothetical protein
LRPRRRRLGGLGKKISASEWLKFVARFARDFRRADWEAFLSELTPDQLKWWRAAYAGVPLEDSWRETDTLARTIEYYGARILAAKAGVKLETKNLSQPGEFIPDLKVVNRGKIQIDNAAIAAHQVNTENRYGNDR